MSLQKSLFSIKHSADPSFSLAWRLLLFVAIIELLLAMALLFPSVSHQVSSLLHQQKKEKEESVLISTENSLVGTKKDPSAKTISTEGLTPENPPEQALSKVAETFQQYTSQRVAQNGDSGILKGSTLGIINIEETPTSDGSHRLKIAIKSESSEPIEVAQVKVEVYFYDQEGGKILPSQSQVASRWLTTPVTWSGQDPELLEVTCLAKNSESATSFLGYIVAVYYKGKLQGYGANPATITNQFPIKVYVGGNDL